MRFVFRSVFASAALLCLLFGGGVHAVDARSVVRIAVMDFSVNGVAPHLGQATGELLRTYFSGAGGIEIVERAQLEALAREQKLHLSGLVDQSTAVQAGRLLGANYIIVGSVNAFGNTLVVTARIIDVQGSRSVSGFDKQSQRGVDGLYEVAMELGVEMLARISPTPTPRTPTPTPPTPTPTPRIPTPTPRIPTPTPLPEQGYVLSLRWDLSRESVDLRDSNRYAITSSPHGWLLESSLVSFSNVLNVVPKHGFVLPSRARTLARYEVETVVLSLEESPVAGVYMGKDSTDIALGITANQAILYFSSGGTAQTLIFPRTVDAGSIRQQAIPLITGRVYPKELPITIGLMYDVNTGEMAGFVNGESVVSGNARRTQGFPNISSVSHAGVWVGTWGRNVGRAMFGTLEFKGK